MRCSCCDRLLNDFEATRKSKATGEYLDTCNKCYSTISDDVKTTTRIDYDPNEMPDDDFLLEEGGDIEEFDDE